MHHYQLIYIGLSREDIKNKKATKINENQK